MGYTFKGQPVGKKVFQAANKSLQYFGHHLEKQEEHKRYRKATVRTIGDFHHSTTTRPMTEEFLLSMYAEEHDVTAAEFIRTYQSVDFPGFRFLQQLSKNSPIVVLIVREHLSRRTFNRQNGMDSYQKMVYSICT